MATKKSSSKQRIRIRLRAFDHRVLDNAVRTIVEVVERTGALVAGPIPLPTKRKMISVNRSTFKHRYSQEQFELCEHGRLLEIIEPTARTIEEISNLDLPAGVDLAVKMM